jgi:hypothetical protein
LGISRQAIVLNVCFRPTSIGEFGIYQGVTRIMLNIVEKYSAETAVESEDGVVAIEYVVVAGAVVAGPGDDLRCLRRDADRPAERDHPEHLTWIRGEGNLPPVRGLSLMNRSLRSRTDDRGVVAIEF